MRYGYKSTPHFPTRSILCIIGNKQNSYLHIRSIPKNIVSVLSSIIDYRLLIGKSTFCYAYAMTTKSLVLNNGFKSPFGLLLAKFFRCERWCLQHRWYFNINQTQSIFTVNGIDGFNFCCRMIVLYKWQTLVTLNRFNLIRGICNSRPYTSALTTKKRKHAKDVYTWSIKIAASN